MYERYIKRALDIIISLISLVVLSPVLLLIAVLIKLESKGPVIFKQKRFELASRINGIKTVYLRHHLFRLCRM